MKTIAQQLNITEFPFIINDKNGNETYYETSSGFWIKREYDVNGNEIYYEASRGYWCKTKYNEKGNEIYYETSTGFWYKKEYDENGDVIYYETSKGKIEDNRIKPIPEYTMEQLIEKLGEDFKLVK